ncbi:hypothetical protein GCM10017559_17670 [Streptosporangium longisporum]|uniref:Uncharacterized protein n=1 Tax=Streptosporangium longisporum TaxID=46187 RepID=A0ABN3XVF4_9ACTN
MARHRSGTAPAGIGGSFHAPLDARRTGFVLGSGNPSPWDVPSGPDAPGPASENPSAGPHFPRPAPGAHFREPASRISPAGRSFRDVPAGRGQPSSAGKAKSRTNIGRASGEASSARGLCFFSTFM